MKNFKTIDMYKLLVISIIVFFYNQKIHAQTPIQEIMISNFYKDLNNSNKDAQSIAQTYLYLKKSKKDMNVRLKLIQELINGFRTINSNKNKDITIKEYRNIKPEDNLIIETNRQKDIFVVQKENEIVLYLLLKKDKIESFNLLRKGGRRSFFMTY